MTDITLTDEQKLTKKGMFREDICTLEDRIKTMPGALIGDNDMNPLKHSFADGCYIREIFNPAGELIVTKIHKVAHPFFLLQGEMSILTEEGAKRIKAPYHGITPAGTKRVIYTHSDIIFVTVHVTKETDLEKIEQEIIAESFDEIDEISATDILLLQEGGIRCLT
ncbi:hypothetical protein LCGC14_1277450 [marine sediment metagenome]|uniref:Uncharacterized protein n=1 Tax=marine sediment metagenome TaxID=412755 RepID=A0A0F9KXZ6_9ZZZZ